MANTPTAGSVLLEWLRDRFTRNQGEALPSGDQPRRRWGIITLCVLIAVVLWFTLSIRETYTIEVEMPTQVANLPDDTALVVLPPATVQVQVRGEGFDLFGLRLNPPTLLIDAQAKEVILEDLVSLPQGITNEGVTPRRFVFQKEPRISRKIPIRSRALVEAAELYAFFDDPVLTPDSIVVSGAASIINDLQDWPTEVFRHTGLQDSLVVTLPLADTLAGLVQKNPTETTLTTVARKYAQWQRVLLVKVREVQTTVRTVRVVSFEPPTVTATYIVPLSQFDQARDDEDFYAWVSYTAILADTTGRVRPQINRPAGVSFLYINIYPSTLQYFERLVDQ